MKRRVLYPSAPERHYTATLRRTMRLILAIHTIGQSVTPTVGSIRQYAGRAARDVVEDLTDTEVITGLGSMRPREPVAATIAGARRRYAANLRRDAVFAMTGRT